MGILKNTESALVLAFLLAGQTAYACGGDYWLNPNRVQFNADSTTIQEPASASLRIYATDPNNPTIKINSAPPAKSSTTSSLCGVDLYFIVPDHGIFRVDNYNGIQFFLSLFDPWWKEEERRRKEELKNILNRTCLEKWMRCTSDVDKAAGFKDMNCGPAAVNYTGTGSITGGGISIGGSAGMTEGRAGDCRAANESLRISNRAQCAYDWLDQCPAGK